MGVEESLSDLAWLQVWQLTVAIMVVGLIAAVACRRRPHLAYALWLVVLVKGLTPPLWTSNTSAFGRLYEPPTPTWLHTVDHGDDAFPARSRQASPADASRLAPQERPMLKDTVASMAARSPVPIWFLAWALGAAGVGVWAVVKIARRNQLLQSTGCPPNQRVAALVATLAKQLAVRPAPTVVVSQSGLGPAVCGFARPRLILPACVAADATPEQLRPIVMHELIHLRRGDHLAAGLQFIFQTVWWFHPLAWRANREMCRVRELCCDAETVRALDAPPRHYAKALVDVLDAKRNIRPVFGFPGVRPIEVTAHRVKEILTMSDRFLARTPMAYWLVALVAGVLLIPGGRLAPDSSRANAAPAATKSEPEAKSAKPVLLLKYGDGKPDGKKSIAGAGQMIRFTLPKGQTNALKAIRVHASRYGHPQPPKEDVEITILSEDMKEPLHTELAPYALFKRQKENSWTLIPFKEPVDVPETFWVVLNFNAEATKGVYVSYDTSTKGEHSRVGYNDEDAEKTAFQGDWMMQAMLAK